MNRRVFLKSATAVACAAGGVSTVEAAEGGGRQQILEWRRYVTKSAEKRDFITNFMGHAVIPALSRQGIKPVGVFHEMPESEDYSVYTLVPLSSLDQVVAVPARLAADPEFLEGARDYLSTEKADPAYERIENSLLLAFEGYPRVQVPRTGDRIFELRIYESHNELKGVLKVEMFNEAELDIFRQVGLDGVFFGQAMVGANLPNLTYMLAYKDKAERGKVWKAFQGHPDWQVLKNRERYKDAVSKITTKFLVPASCSEV